MKPGVWWLTRSHLAWLATGITVSQIAWWAAIDAGLDAFAASAAILALGLPAYTYLVYRMALDIFRAVRKRRRGVPT